MTPPSVCQRLSLMLRLSFALVAVWLADPAKALEFSSQRTAEGKKITVCKVDLRNDKLGLFWSRPDGKPLRTLQALEKQVTAQQQTLRLGMNAGMYHGDMRPVGLCVIEGKEISPLNLASAPGNFFLKPNGVFALTANGPVILESNAYAAAGLNASFATQSGPMLVIEGALHPAFQQGSKNRLLRNGVGMDVESVIWLCISEEPVNFYDFASFFRDTMRCQNALFLDGTVCSLLAPELKRSDFRMDLGPMLGALKPAAK
jgi:uncharacterized protein YigE (DUF2233 family)